LNIISIDPSLRSCGFYGSRDFGNDSSFSIQEKGDRIQVLGLFLRRFEEQAKYYDALLIEDYAFSRHSQSVTVQAEVGGLARAAFSAENKPVIEVGISTWKYITGISGKKATKKERADYIDLVYKKFGQGFDSTDSADAWMIYYSCAMIAANNILPTEPTERLRLEMDKKGIVFNTLLTKNGKV